VRGSYDRSWRFALLDRVLLVVGCFQSPYALCRRFFALQGSGHLGVYGETPLRVVQKLASIAAIDSGDVWVDLGSGRGRSCFWMAHFTGCSSLGIEQVPSLIRQGQWVARLFKVPNVRFEETNWRCSSLSTATCLYFYATLASDEELADLSRKICQECSLGVRIITISTPLPILPYCWEFPLTFPWGTTLGYLHIFTEHIRQATGEDKENF
jgi:hypothetical protein